MRNLIALAVVIVLAFFFFLGHHCARKDYERDMEQWREKTKLEIKEELRKEAEKNYEVYLRDHGIDSMDYRAKLQWLLSNSPYR